ncbi:uncharacterized protein LY89DRAFT_51358 [Mollisia scopiformis]|uniref:Uncharacterized protein n=1 Tax=Mollisia scopiformis TaxID=149040 RepID=A0A194XAY8_MOLSC|nr:uncharacterized protein LY89DRAFT_51358 [Mollisia scopiformis]KUJ17338.1 hypothetical protein LY89DRAFT_51358 [Mollisia scopiformis]
MISSGSFRIVFAFLILLPLVSASTCYWPDGSDADSAYVACNSTASTSACCSANDACTTFGWCLGASGMTYRGGCTDQNWNSPACMTSYCQGVKDDYQFLMNCNSGNYVAGETLLWCCSTNSAGSCCSNNFSLPFSVENGLTGRAFMSDLEQSAVTVTKTASAATGTGSPTSSVASQSASQSSSQNATLSAKSSSSGVSTGAIAGASVGCAIGGALLGAAIASLLLRRRRSSSPTELPAENNGAYPYDAPKNPYPGTPSSATFTPDQNNYTPVTQQYHPQPVVPMQEAPTHAPNYELDGQHH